MGRRLQPPSAPSPTSRPSSPPSFRVDFDRHVAGYLAELRRRGLSPGTIDHAGRKLRAFGAFLIVEPRRPFSSLTDITPELVAAYRDHELSRPRQDHKNAGPLSASTLRGTVYVLRGFFEHLLSHELILLDPARDLAYPRLAQRLPRAVPTAKQMRRLLSAPAQESFVGLRDRAILELLYGSGLRNAELCALRHGDIDFARRAVHVRHGKGDKERVVPMGRRAAEALALYYEKAWLAFASRRLATSRKRKKPAVDVSPAAATPVFFNRLGLPLTPQALRGIVKLYRKRLKLDLAVTPHSLRHACATHLLRGGADIRQIQVLLGHASLRSTEVYTKVETSDLRAMLDRCHPRQNPTA